MTGNGIASITKTGTSGLVDTYTITYTNGNTTTFTITNGEDGEVTETELDVLRQKVANQQKVIDQLPQVTGQGTSITLENTIEAQFTKFDIEGHSEQETTEGKNKLENKNSTTTSNGITFTPNKDGSTATPYEPYTNGASPNPSYEQPIESAGDNENLFDKDTIINNKFILSSNGDMINNNNWCQSDFIVVNSNMNYVISNSNLVDTTGYYEISEYNENYEWIRSRQTGTKEAKEVAFTILENTKYIRAGYRTDKGLENIKIEQGTVATPYSPYGMGSITEKIVNKNLVEKNLKGYIASGYMSIDNASESFVFWAEQGKTYNYSCLKNTNRSVCAKSKTINIVNGTPLTNKREVSHSFTSNFTGWCVLYVNSSLDNEIKDSFMIEQGSTATGYVPHEGQTYSIYTQQPFRSIGDVRDKFVKVNGNWFERHLPYIASYNGETLPQDVYNEEGGIKYCNSKSMSTTGQFSNGASVQYVDENNWNYLPCTPEQIQQLENLPSTYKDFTIIQSEDETEAYLEVSGIYDLNNLINN